MTYGFEFHDSVLLDAFVEPDGRGFILFRASVYQSEGQVFTDAQVSGWQDVRFLCEGMRIEGRLDLRGEYAVDGALWIGEEELGGHPLLPIDRSGNVRLELVLSPDFETTTVYATRIVSSFEGAFEPESSWDTEGNVTNIR